MLENCTYYAPLAPIMLQQLSIVPNYCETIRQENGTIKHTKVTMINKRYKSTPFLCCTEAQQMVLCNLEGTGFAFC